MKTFFVMLCSFLLFSTTHAQSVNENAGASGSTKVILHETAASPINYFVLKRKIETSVPRNSKKSTLVQVKVKMDPKGHYESHVIIGPRTVVQQQAIDKHIVKIKFVPAKLNGEKIASERTLPFRFFED